MSGIWITSAVFSLVCTSFARHSVVTDIVTAICDSVYKVFDIHSAVVFDECYVQSSIEFRVLKLEFRALTE